MNRLLFFILAALALGCSNGGENSVDKYFSPGERDTLLADIVTYIYILPKHATVETRFDNRFRSYYVESAKKFHFENYFIAEDSTHYFYLIRPARSSKGTNRGVGGKLRLDENKNIVEFKEVFNTPPAGIDVLQERGERLFKELVRKGNVNDYLHHPDYIEWPDKMTFYDTLTHQWVLRPGI
jgi:hypothetical protein